MKTEKNESFSKMFYLLRETFPKSQIFYFIFFCLKLVGLFLSTHNVKGYENNLYTISLFLQKLTLFGFSLKVASSGYMIGSFIIFFLLLFMIIASLIVYYQLNRLHISKSSSHYEYLTNKRFLSKTHKYLMKIIGVIYLILLFFSQYLFEYLSFVIYATISKDKMKSGDSMFNHGKLNELGDFFGKLLISPIILCIINTISFICLLVLLFTFFLFNSIKGLWLPFGFNGYSNKMIMFSFVLLSSFQPFYTFEILLNDETMHLHRIILNIISVVILSGFLFSHLKNFNYYPSFIPLSNLFIGVWCWYAGILEIFIFYICDRPFTQAYSFLKLIVELTNAVLFTYLILTVNKRYFLSLFTSHLFNLNNKQSHIGEIYTFIHLLTQVLSNKLPEHLELVSLIYLHKSKCVTTGCPCNQLFNEKEKDINDITLKQMLIIVGEQDIVNRIYQLYKKNKASHQIEDYCVLHTGYIYAIKQHLSFALYLAYQYLHSKIRLGFITECYLYEIRKQIIEEAFKGKRQDNLIFSKKTSTKKQMTYYELFESRTQKTIINQKNKTFYDYITFIDITKSLMLVCCKGIENILSIRSSLQNTSKSNIAMDKNQYDHFIQSCEIIKLNNEKLIKLITNQMKGEPLCHSELSYLITNYFELIYKQTPLSIKGKFAYISNISDMKRNEYIYDYLKYNIQSPVILKFTQNESFIIEHISINLCEKLNYSKESLIGKDIHDLIPIEFIANHRLLMKQFLFIQNTTLKKDTFILNSDRNLVHVSVNCNVLPSFKNPFYIIMEMKVINHNSPSNFVYFFILNNDMNILAVNKRFEEQFFFTIRMIELLKVNFCGFFGINQSKFNKTIKEYAKNSKNNNLEEENKAIAILANIKQEKIYCYRKIKEELKVTHNSFETILQKQQVIDGLSTLIKIINDLGLDIEWYNRIRYLSERIKVSLEKNLPNDLNTFYQVHYFLRQIGRQRYFVVKMIENINVEDILNNTLYLHDSLIKQKIDTSQSLEFKTPNAPVKGRLKSMLMFDKSKSNLSFNLPEYSPRQRGAKQASNPVAPTNTSLHDNNSMVNGPTSQTGGIDSELMISSTSKYHLLHKNSFINKSSKAEYSASTDHNFNSMNITSSYTKKRSTMKNNLSAEQNDVVINETKRRLMYIEYNKLSHRYTMYYYTTSIVLLMMIIIFIIVKNSQLNLHHGLFYISTYSSMIKADLLFGAMINLGICIDTDIQSSSISFPQESYERLLLISNDLIEHYSTFTSYLNLFVSNNNLNTIYDTINVIESYDYLQKNWGIKNLESSLTEIIYTYRLFFSNKNDPSTINCRLKDLFFNEKFKDENNIENIEGPTIEEQLLFFSMYNLMSRIKPKFERILNESIKLLFFYHNYYSDLVCIYNIVIWILMLWFLFILFRKVMIDQKLTKTICSYIYTQPNQEQFDEQRIIAFKAIIIDFNRKKIEAYESFKKNNNTINSCKTQHSVILSRNKNSGPLNSPLTQVTKHSLQKNNIKLQMQNTRKFQHTIQPTMFNSAVWIILGLLIIISGFEGANICLTYYWEKQFIFATCNALNFLEKMPLLIEMLYYTGISSIVNIINFLPSNDPTSLEKQELLNYYNIVILLEDDTQIHFLNNSLYSTLYGQAAMVKKNIDIFWTNNKEILYSSIYWEDRFNEKNAICIYAVLGCVTYNKETYESSYDYFNYINTPITQCRIQSQSISENNLDSSIDYLIQSLTNLYYDFAKKDHDQRDISKFLQDHIVYQINNGFVTKLVFETYYRTIMNDLDSLHNQIKTNELLLSFIMLIIFLFILIYSLIGIIHKSTHYKNLLVFFVNLAFTSQTIDLSLYNND